MLGVEKDAELVERARTALVEVLLANGVNKAMATNLAGAWVMCDDFLANDSGIGCWFVKLPTAGAGGRDRSRFHFSMSR